MTFENEYEKPDNYNYTKSVFMREMLTITSQKDYFQDEVDIHFNNIIFSDIENDATVTFLL